MTERDPYDDDRVKHASRDDEWPPCWVCHGRGTVNPLTAPKGFFCVSSTECPACDGTGEEP